MTGRKNFHAITGKVALMVVLFCVLGVSSASAQDWHFGIGTGLVRMNAQGDQGLNIAGVGPILADVDLDPDDFDDLIQTAIGFGGYATNGKWMVQYMLASIKMGGEPSGTLPGGAAFTSDLSFDVTTGFLTLGYTAYRQGRLSIQPFVGMRYFKHELGADVSVATAPPTDISASVDHNWTDVLVGLPSMWLYHQRCIGVPALTPDSAAQMVLTTLPPLSHGDSGSICPSARISLSWPSTLKMAK